MKAYAGFEAKKNTYNRQTLPAGGYVARILDVHLIGYDWGEVLQLSFDITEGEYKDFFRNDYRENPNADKKWRGVLRINVPKDDGSERDGWTKRAFEAAMWAFEESNPGYRWDWNEEGLKNRLVGVLFRNREWVLNGQTGWSTEACAADSVARVRTGAFKMPKDKPLPASANTYNTYSSPSNPTDVSFDDDDLPF